MAITRIRASTKGESTTASATSSFGTLPAAGNTVVIMGFAFGTTGLVAGAATDNQGNTYTLVKAAANASGPLAVGIWVCASIGTPSGTFTVTVPFTNGSVVVCVAVEVSPCTLPIDGNASNTGTSGTITSGTTAATTQADEIAFSVFTELNGSTVTISSGSSYTVDFTETNNNTWQQGGGGDKILTATGTQSASWTDSGTGVWVCEIVTLKGVSAATVLPWPGLQVRQAVNRASTY